MSTKMWRICVLLCYCLEQERRRGFAGFFTKPLICPADILKRLMACHQLTDFVTKTVLFENRIAEYIDVFEKRERRIVRFAVQKIIIGDAP